MLPYVNMELKKEKIQFWFPLTGLAIENSFAFLPVTTAMATRADALYTDQRPTPSISEILMSGAICGR